MQTKSSKLKSIQVLSLFDGISCCKLGLEKNNTPIDNYYSSEICKDAISIQNHNFGSNPNFHQIGDVRQINGADFANIDLICAGSPCTQLSAINSKDRSGLEGSESSLFFEFIRIIGEIKSNRTTNKPLYVLLENVWSMGNSEKNKITQALSEVMGEKINPIYLDSESLAPCHRRRYYWTNIPNIPQIVPNASIYQDCVVNGYVDKDKANVLLSSNLTLTHGIQRYYKMNIGNIIFKHKEFAELSKEEKLKRYPDILKKSNYNWKENRNKNLEYDFPNGCYRIQSVLECERFMTIPDGHVSNVEGVSKSAKYKAIGLSMTVDIIAHILSPLNELLGHE